MFETILRDSMYNIGMNEKAFDSLMRDEAYLSDNKIFAISRMINEVNPNVFLSRRVGKLYIKCRRFNNVSIVYTITSTNPCNIIVDFNTFDLEVEYTDRKLVIDSNLSDYRGDKTKLIDIRQCVLNEMMIRYFSKILTAIYKELRWYTR